MSDEYLNQYGQTVNEALPKEFRLERSEIKYIEKKLNGQDGPATIGRVYFSKSGKTLYYKGQRLQSLKGSGDKANYFDVETGDYYWISSPKKDQNNRLTGGNRGVTIDSDVKEAYLDLLGQKTRTISNK